MDITQGAIGFIIGCLAMYIGFLRQSHNPAGKLEKTTGGILMRKLRDLKRKLYKKLYRKLYRKL